MICNKCGNQLEAGQKFCGKCGNPIDWSAPEEAVVNEVVTEAEATETTTEEVQEPVVEIAEESVETTPEATPVETPVEETSDGPVVEVVELSEDVEPEAEATAPVEEAQPEQAQSGDTVFFDATAQNVGAEQTQPVYGQDPYQQQAAYEQPYQQEDDGNGAVPPVPPVKVKFTDKAKAFFAATSPVKFIIPAVVVAAVVVVAVNVPAIINSVRKITMSEEDYTTYVLTNKTDEYIETMGSLYDEYFVDALNVGDKSIEAEVSVDITKKGQEQLEDSDDYEDLSWIKSAKIGYSAATNKSNAEASASANINGTDIVSANTMVNMEDGVFYLQIPELSDKYVSLEYADMFKAADIDVNKSYQASMEMMNGLSKSCPNKAALEKISKKYVSAIVKEIDDVKISKNKIKAGDVSKSYTELKFTIDRETMYNMEMAFYDQVLEDDDLEKIIVDSYDGMSEAIADYAEAMGEYDEDFVGKDGQDIYDELIEQVEKDRDRLEEMEDYYLDSDKDICKVKIYVDRNGEIRGIKISSDDGRDELECLAPKSMGKLGFSLKFTDGSETTSFEGTGKSHGGKVSGEFKFKYDGVKIAEITTKNFDVKALKKGHIKGKFIIKPSSNVGDIARSLRSSENVLKDLEITADLDITPKKSDVSLEFVNDKEKVATVKFSSKITKGKSVSEPSSSKTILIEDQDDIDDYFDTVDFDKFISRLEKADVPDDYTDEIEDAFDELEDNSDIVYNLINKKPRASETYNLDDYEDYLEDFDYDEYEEYLEEYYDEYDW